MEAASWFSVASVVFLAIGVAIGVAAGHFLSPSIGEARRLRADLDRLQHEHDSYRSSVNSHFRKTADLVGEMTKSYAAVYDHLAGGARRFCDESGSDAAIPFEPLPGALASPVIETAADAATDGAAPDLRGQDAARQDAAADTAEVAAEEYAPDGYATEEYAAKGYAAEDVAAEDDAPDDYAPDDYEVAAGNDTAEETEEARARS